MKSRVVFISLLLLLCFQCSHGLGSGESGTAVVPSPDRSADGADLRSSVGTMCAVVMNLSAADRCAFVKTTPDCSMEDSFINYLKMVFCLLPPNLTPLTITFCMIWLLFLFIVLGLTASKFFCPNLSAISSTLRLTHNGVTFLALGNGAPDVFSATVAFSHPHTAGLAIGALFGAGIFVTTVVAGAVSLVKPFTVATRPFLRDVIFYMAAVFWTFVILYRGTISLGETLGYLGLYVVYVITVIVSAYIYSHQKHSVTRNSEYCPLLPYCESTSSILLSSLNPVDRRKWRRKTWCWRAIKILKTPLEVLLLLTVPVTVCIGSRVSFLSGR
ncbi:unnamed protein product [Coregonus sp. 'balchen']|nr:unnamed protein product [Coregonus sp. 'balchen']